MMLIPTVPTAYIEWRNYVDDTEKTLEHAALALSSEATRKRYADLLFGNFANRDASFIILEDKVSVLATLKDGWDSFNAPAPSPESIKCAKEALARFHSEQLLPETVSPSAEGGVSIYFSHGKQKAFIEFSNEGEMLFARYGKDDEPHVQVLRSIEDVSNQAVQGIRDHLREGA